MEGVKPEKLIRLSKSCLSISEKQAVIRVLDSEYLGMGVEVQKFEKELSEFFGRPAVCVSTGTAALHLALQAAGIGSGDEVLVQSLTYIASFQAISATGARPVACDVDPKTLCLDWLDAEKRLTPKTKAVMPVHYSGGVGALDEIYEFANRHGLRVIEDAAHAFGSTYQEKKVGSFGDVACFSFDGIKNITSGDGGCIVTDDKEIIRKVRDARLLGVEKDSEQRYAGKRSWEFDVSTQGWRYHMSNIMAAIGVEQLNRFPEFAAKRQRLAKLYDKKLSVKFSGDIFQQDYNQVVPHIYVVRISQHHERQKIMEMFDSHGIQTGVHYQPNHKLSYYQPNNEALLVSDQIYPFLLSLPLHFDLLDSDVHKICDLLMGYLDSQFLLKK